MLKSITVKSEQQKKKVFEDRSMYNKARWRNGAFFVFSLVLGEWC